jgi:hypothetical protein
MQLSAKHSAARERLPAEHRSQRDAAQPAAGTPEKLPACER